MTTDFLLFGTHLRLLYIDTKGQGSVEFHQSSWKKGLHTMADQSFNMYISTWFYNPEFETLAFLWSKILTVGLSTESLCEAATLVIMNILPSTELHQCPQVATVSSVFVVRLCLQLLSDESIPDFNIFTSCSSVPASVRSKTSFRLCQLRLRTKPEPVNTLWRFVMDSEM